MNLEKDVKYVETLMAKAAEQRTAIDAMQFAQAALSVATALSSLARNLSYKPLPKPEV